MLLRVVDGLDVVHTIRPSWPHNLRPITRATLFPLRHMLEMCLYEAMLEER